MKVLSLISIFVFLSLTNLSLIRAAPGDLDRSLGNDGIIKTSFTEAGSIGTSTIQSDGKIIVVGDIAVANAVRDFYVLRFNTDGSFDTTFGTGGRR